MDRLDLDSITKNAGVNDPINPGYAIGQWVLPYAFSLAAILLLIYMVSGGLQMMFAKGDPKALQSAQGKITTALIGFVVVILSYYIVNLFGRIFGITIFEEIF